MSPFQQTGRRLRKNHSNALPRYVIAYHVVSQDSDVTRKKRRIARAFRLGTAITWRLRGTEATQLTLHDIKTPADFWRLVSKLSGPRHTTWVIGHNILDSLVMSDFPSLFERSELTIDWPRSKRIREDNNEDNCHAQALCIIDAPPTIIACKYQPTQGRCVFVDTLNWFQCPISEISAAANLTYEKKPSRVSSDDQHRIYSSRCCEIVAKCFIELADWVRKNDMGMFRYTGPSQAMAAFRHRFMVHDICIHDNFDVKDIERQAMFGGRTEVFKFGTFQETVHQLDINSLFPSVMAAREYPCLLHRFELHQHYSPELPPIDWQASVAEVILRTPAAIFPCRIDGRVVYPKGMIATTLCGLELCHAYRKGYISAVKSWAEYRTAPLFREWVETLWAMRQEYKQAGNGLYEQFAKRLLNSLYGKFAQRSAEWVNVPNDIAHNCWSNWSVLNLVTNERKQYRAFGWQTQEKVKRGELASTFVAISAFVTSAARMKMNFIRSVVGHGNCYYQGVDSVIVTNEGLERLKAANLVADTQLGKLRLQLSTNDGEILGCSDYVLGGKVVLSGRAKDWELAEGDELLLNRLTGLRYLFNGKVMTTVIDDVLPWTRQGRYRKGIVNDNGWVHPYQFENLPTSSDQLLQDGIAEHPSQRQSSTAELETVSPFRQ